MQHRIELNIGLETNKGQHINSSRAISALCQVFTPTRITTHCANAASNELTLVVDAVSNVKPSAKTIGRLCEMLEQDCIAGKVGGAGFLIGPNTEPYGGEFNADYWLEPVKR